MTKNAKDVAIGGEAVLNELSWGRT